eukprot:TRINITY_DN12856_c0_g1_i1.p1 TRINITY_DN12856_c0_g1~~TRINITY_DN12856_c0_g1_i1.p1  ORF type:complete len:441 (-),score=64.38 TRINITY_DN12856_c0_g1_i1:41-1363(-)
MLVSVCLKFVVTLLQRLLRRRAMLPKLSETTSTSTSTGILRMLRCCARRRQQRVYPESGASSEVTPTGRAAAISVLHRQRPCSGEQTQAQEPEIRYAETDVHNQSMHSELADGEIERRQTNRPSLPAALAVHEGEPSSNAWHGSVAGEFHTAEDLTPIVRNRNHSYASTDAEIRSLSSDSSVSSSDRKAASSIDAPTGTSTDASLNSPGRVRNTAASPCGFHLAPQSTYCRKDGYHRIASHQGEAMAKQHTHGQDKQDFGFHVASDDRTIPTEAPTGPALHRLSGRAWRRAKLAALDVQKDAPTEISAPLPPPGADGSLHMAASLGSTGFARLLLWARADVDAPDGLGATALHYAAGGGHGEVLDELILAGAKAFAHDARRQTPLHYAAGGRSRAVVDALLSARGDPRAMDVAGDTPLSIALQVRNQEFAMAMVESARAI